MKKPRTLLSIVCALLSALGSGESAAAEARGGRGAIPKTMLFPEHLRPGDKIRVVAPSSFVTPEAFTRAVEDIRGLGFVPVYRGDALDEHVDFAGTHARRVNEFLEALHDQDTRAIWAVRGGYGASYLLPHISTEDIRAARKWLVGFRHYGLTCCMGAGRRCFFTRTHRDFFSTLGTRGGGGNGVIHDSVAAT